jgi:hypothetical protein
MTGTVLAWRPKAVYGFIQADATSSRWMPITEDVQKRSMSGCLETINIIGSTT